MAPPSTAAASDQMGAPPAAAVSRPTPRTGPPPEAGLPGWMVPPLPTLSTPLYYKTTLEWHGNLELDGGYVKYTFPQSASLNPEIVHDSRGRFVLGPMLTHDFGTGYFLRATGQVVGWVLEQTGGNYQINVDDVYVQVGKQGLWDFMAGRFLTWRVFRKGLGFDLYTLEDTGARTAQDFSASGGFLRHMYEVNTIFMRDPPANTGTGEGAFIYSVPPGRAAFHLYPNSWSGIELVGSNGRFPNGSNALGGRLAAGIMPKYFSLLVGAEYEGWLQGPQLPTCDKCGTGKAYGAGGSLAVTPIQQLEIAINFAKQWEDGWAPTLGATEFSDTTRSWGGYLQFDAGSLLMQRSLILGGAFFNTQYTNINQDYQFHDQMAGYLVYPLGFNRAAVKLVFSEANGYDQPLNGPTLHGSMWSLRLRFAFYY